MAEQILVTRSSMPEFGEYMDEIQGLWDQKKKLLQRI